MASSSSKRSLLLLLLIAALAISSLLLASASKDAAGAVGDDLDEDLSFLEEEEDDASAARGHGPHGGHEFDIHSGDESDGSSSDGDESDVDEIGHGGFDDAPEAPAIDETDVVVLTEKNFSDFLGKNRHVMVEFYAPWCGHCQALAPEYAAAATALRGEDVALAKVDATEENELAQRFEVQGFPTVLFFIDGVHKDYPGHRTKEAIVTWIKKKIGPGVQNITIADEAEKILTSESKIVLGYLNSLVGAESEEFSAASKLEDGVSFYQTDNPDVAKLFHIDANAKRPSVVLLKKEAEKISYFDGQFSKSAIVDFVFANKLPLVTTFTRESASEIFDNPIKSQLLLFSVSNETEKVVPAFQEAAKHFKGKLIFVYVERDNEDVGVPVSEYFGVSGEGPKVLAYSGNEDAKKYILDGEMTADNIKKFGEDFLGDKLKPFYKSGPIPENNDGDVKIVVGNNFDDIVLDESKDVLLEIYAPWCGHCQALEPVYNKLARHLRGVESLVIAKMDGTANEHPRAKADGFPTLLFFPAGNKSFDPVTVDTDRTVVAFYKFIKKHATIPFKLQKSSSTKEAETTDAPASADAKSGTTDQKDEL